METNKIVISANTYVIFSVEESKVIASKWRANSHASVWSTSTKEVSRMLGFGSVGRKMLSEDIAKRLGVNYEVALKIVAAIA